MDLDFYICNKCFVPPSKGSHPYNLTQCGHIFCLNCIQQVRQQCSQCQFNNPEYLSLNELPMPRTISFFEPHLDIWETLQKADIFRNNQWNITFQRFRELEIKYERIKHQIFTDMRNYKILREKYINLKDETDNIQKKILELKNLRKMQIDSQSVSHSSGTKSVSGSFLNFCNITPTSVRLNNWKQEYQIDADGFRIPDSRRSGNSRRFTSDTDSNYTK